MCSVKSDKCIVGASLAYYAGEGYMPSTASYVFVVYEVSWRRWWCAACSVSTSCFYFSQIALHEPGIEPRMDTRAQSAASGQVTDIIMRRSEVS